MFFSRLVAEFSPDPEPGGLTQLIRLAGDARSVDVTRRSTPPVSHVPFKNAFAAGRAGYERTSSHHRSGGP